MTTRVTVLSLAGKEIAFAELLAEDTVLALKACVQQQCPQAPPRWQRLLQQGGSFVGDQVTVGSLLGAGSECAPPSCGGSVVLQLVLTVDPWDLLKPESAVEAAAGLDALGAAGAGHMARLFEDAAGDVMPPPQVEETLYSIMQSIERGPRGRDLLGIRRGLLPHAVSLLRDDRYKESRRCRLGLIFNWLGPVAQPQLVAWVGLSSRPLADGEHWRVEHLHSQSACARVRVAARVALSDRGGHHKARAEELGAAWRSLHRYAAGCVPEDRAELLRLKDQALAKLRAMAREATNAHTRYAVAAALR